MRAILRYYEILMWTIAKKVTFKLSEQQFFIGLCFPAYAHVKTKTNVTKCCLAGKPVFSDSGMLQFWNLFSIDNLILETNKKSRQ